MGEEVSLCDLATPGTPYERPACSKEEMPKGEFGRMYRLDSMSDECHWFEDYHSTPIASCMKSSGQEGSWDDVATVGVTKVYICPLIRVGSLTWPRECAKSACYSGCQ